MSILATNKRARFDYELIEQLEAGIVLFGHEVKSIKSGHVHLKSAYVSYTKGELVLVNMYIAPYLKSGSLPTYDPERRRKLLLNKSEIRRIENKKLNNLFITVTI